MITFSGLACNAIAHLAVLFYGTTDFSERVPSWVFYIYGSLFILYIMFDNLDGIQARRVRAGSPMGMMVDHGVDALTAALFPISTAKLWMPGNNLIIVVASLTATIPFWFANLESYYTGGVRLPPINGQGEGSVILCAACFIITIIPNEVYFAPIIGDWYGIQLLTFLIVGSQVLFAAWK